jgi:hypothetical protein
MPIGSGNHGCFLQLAQIGDVGHIEPPLGSVAFFRSNAGHSGLILAASDASNSLKFFGSQRAGSTSMRILRSYGDARDKHQRPEACQLVRFDQYPVWVNRLKSLYLNCQII